jgi:lipopolysaccharide export system permease protein
MIRTLLWRYLASRIYIATGWTLLAFLGLFFFFDFVNELDNLNDNQYQVRHALIYVLLILPGRVHELLPIAVLIGTLHALGTLARQAEITVMRASGLSSAQCIGGRMAMGLGFVLINVVFGEYLAPPAERAAQQWRLMATGATVGSELRSGLWMRDGPRFVNVRTVLPDRSLEEIRIYTFDEAFRLSTITQAARGVFSPGEGWHLETVTHTRFAQTGISVTQTTQELWASDLSPDMLSVLMVQPERMSAGHLYPYIRHLKENHQQAHRYEIALWKKLVYPFSSLVMMLLALPFAYRHDRMGGAGWRLFLGVMLGVGFYLLNGLFSNLGVIHVWPAPLSALLPSLVFLSAGLFMLWWMQHR